MANALTRKFSGKGYTELAAACGEIKKWCENASLGHEADELKFSISATVSSPMEGQARLFRAEDDSSLTPIKKRSHKKKVEA